MFTHARKHHIVYMGKRRCLPILLLLYHQKETAVLPFDHYHNYNSAMKHNNGKYTI